jgi:dipeptidyl aminopeptidase/acylaminoacyl peptidase
VCSSDLLSLFLVASYSDVQPDKYLLYDARKREIGLIAESMPWINPDAFCPMLRMSFSTRDSLRLSGYFTKPKNLNPPYATVVLLHGGPQARDAWDFDPEVQLLATRGYAVLQINYRGSSGFGRKISYDRRYDYFEMHQDVTDATRKAIHAGLVDSNRVAIMGASFGGYLAVSGAAFEPDLYSCAISNAGVFDWQMQWKHFKDLANSRYYDEMQNLLSSKGDEKKFLDTASPIHKAQQIRIPVLIAAGWDDNRVPIAQSYQLERKMKQAGNKPETFFKLDETHGFHYEENRIKYYQKVLSFLAKNIDKTKRLQK